MKKLTRYIVAGSMVLIGGQAVAQTCVVAFPEQNGSWATIEGNQFGGPLIESADQVFAAAGLEVVHHPVTPWAEVLRKFNEGEIDILAIALRSREREKTMKFAGPWLSYRWGPFTLAETDTEELKSPKIGVNRALKNVQPIPRYLARLNGIPVWESQANLIVKLANGELDIILGDQGIISRQAAQTNVKVKELPGADMRMTAYMAIHHESPCSVRVDDLDRAIRNWKKAGGHEQLITAVANTN